jgi:hypothetical protein
VLPKDSFELYKKPIGKGHARARLNFFGPEFKSKRLKAWLIDLRKAEIIAKASFAKIFNVAD